MLDFIYYPVSALLKFWHFVFGSFLDPASGSAWALAVVFLVFTLRVVLLKPFISQLRSSNKLRSLAPELEQLKRRFGNDRQGLALAQHELRQQNGVSALAGCLPALVQAPVVLGLIHVLHSFNRTGSPLHLTAAENAATPNYFFSATDVQSFLNARLFGAPLSGSLVSSGVELTAFGGDITIANIAIVAVPLMIIACLATHFTARASLARQSRSSGTVEQSVVLQPKLMRNLMLWIFPLGALVSGPFLPLAILLYWVANNGWTLLAQHFGYRWVDRSRP